MKRYSSMAPCLFSLSALCNIAFADDVTDLISKSEASGAQSINEVSGLIDDFRKYAVQPSGLASFGSKSLPSASGRKFPKKEALKLPHDGKGNCKASQGPYQGLSQGSSKCPSSLFEAIGPKQAGDSLAGPKLLVFVSESVPSGSIKELWGQANRVGAKLLFRGLVGGSFKKTQNYIRELGIVADIDPIKFEQFGISHVPAFVISQGNKHDKMVGNVSLAGFLEQAGISGDLKEEAARLYNKLHGGQL
jgi:type-F conjugative transfer system pilin assembly protein TrbC